MSRKIGKSQLLWGMILLNFTMITFISMVIFASILKISDSMHAMEYLRGASQLPPRPWMVPVISIIGYLIMVTLMRKNIVERISQFILIPLQIILTLTIIFSLHMNYNGIIFLLAAYLLECFKHDKRKLFIITLTGTFLLIFDFSLCARVMPITSFETYVTYYRDGISSIILAIKNIGTTGNIIFFIVYTIFLLTEQLDENEKIFELNAQLNLTNIELQHANEELENYVKESEKNIQTKERNRLAREIHDTLGHTLTGIIAGLDAAITILPISTEQTKNQLEVVQKVAREGMKDVRRSVNALRPDVLDREDLLTAINQSIKNMAATSNVEITFNNTIENLKFNEDEEDIIYRIIQESITNSIRHGKATEIDIDMSKEYSIVSLEISDNGIGASNLKYGFGLTHMEERLNMLNGKLFVESNNGFKVKALIPIRWGEDND